MGIEYEYVKCPKCKVLMIVVLGASTKCGRCWEGEVKVEEKPDQDGGSE